MNNEASDAAFVRWAATGGGGVCRGRGGARARMRCFIKPETVTQSPPLCELLLGGGRAHLTVLTPISEICALIWHFSSFKRRGCDEVAFFPLFFVPIFDTGSYVWLSRDGEVVCSSLKNWFTSSLSDHFRCAEAASSWNFQISLLKQATPAGATGGADIRSALRQSATIHQLLRSLR